ncbi:MAG: hypothetical protein M3436_00770 [Pseudomonadota bacterium]|nr:hypothetical protein [Pseudomonadota bacterium]
MLIQLRDESGLTLQRSFAHDDMEGAADYCLEHYDCGVTWLPEGGEADWDEEVFLAMLESR